MLTAVDEQVKTPKFTPECANNNFHNTNAEVMFSNVAVAAR